jgi:uncharacterized protein YjiS (DUF1127 family)
MWPSYISNPEFAVYRERAVRERNEGMARAGYLAIVGLGRLQADLAGFVLPRIERAIGSYRAWRDRHAALRELRVLDDRLLRDIGLTRADLDGVVRAREAAAEAEVETVSPEIVVVAQDVALRAYAEGRCDDEWLRAA